MAVNGEVMDVANEEGGPDNQQRLADELSSLVTQQQPFNLTPAHENIDGVFIICWLPFFITHILKTYCQVPPELYTAFTWLGYVNSAVNPVIYTTFNIEFRKAFLKILHC
ncbi:hypothetical protein DNTS_025735 [Danionella cerebrum]|uniref:G-protein coupled receptors family 1 profile domain-containing protein n=1 Tax=Danionella cerebrum TaxID=2873325 RepID=A0A553NLX6_9TELE|nr:hypothetical protein DNTS_025735 [Danionella translucida]